MPKRIQMHRRKGGWRKDHPDAVIVARPTKWGNPYHGDSEGRMDRALVTRLFALYLALPEQAARVAEIKADLRGKDLACWCPPDEPCHADVLLEIANDQ
jgi:hypothetical protein